MDTGAGRIGEVYVSAELIGIIAAAIALGTPMLASLRSLRQEIRDVRGDVQNVHQRVDHVRGELRDEMKALETRLRAEMQSGFKELTARVINIGDRLSKVEGIIEGMFWSGRNQSPDNKREGAA